MYAIRPFVVVLVMDCLQWLIALFALLWSLRTYLNAGHPRGENHGRTSRN